MNRPKEHPVPEPHIKELARLWREMSADSCRRLMDENFDLYEVCAHLVANYENTKAAELSRNSGRKRSLLKNL